MGHNFIELYYGTKPYHSIIQIIGILLAIVILGIGVFPEIVYLPNDSSMANENWLAKLQGLYIILPDDVMITMRVAKFFLQSGYTGFNYSDVAQPATSFVLPIVLSPLFYAFPDNIALVLVSLLGVVVFSAAGFIIAQNANSKLRILLLLIFFFNSTTLGYLFSGWEHLWQCFFVVLTYATAYHLDAKHNDLTKYIVIGLSAALAVLIRPDSIFLVAPLFVWIYLSSKDIYRLFSFFVFGLLSIGYMYFQWQWFGVLTPTPARLKAGSIPEIGYSFHYLLRCIIQGGAVAFIPLLILFFRDSFLDRKSPGLAAAAGIILASAYAFFVSDVFPYGRMFLAPLALTLLVASRSTLPESSEAVGSYRHPLYKISTLALFGVFLGASFLQMEMQSAIRLIQKPFAGYSATVEQLVLSKYIKKHISPSDGAIGQFWAGTVSFYMMDYNIADLLGKADEDIAKLPTKWGPPGHNKWDADISLSKWNPIVIPFPETTVLESEETKKKILIRKREDFAFWADYDITLRKRGYIFCKPYPQFNFGLYVRQDFMDKLTTCK